MKRRLFNAGAAASLMLGLSLLILWVRSYWVCDFLVYERPGWHLNMALMHGEIQLNALELLPGETLSSTGYYREQAWGRWEARDLWRFDLDRFLMPGGSPHYCASIPYWLPALLAVTLTVWLLRHRPGRYGKDRCPACGYDLRGTPSGASGGTCPECGFRPPEPPEGAVSSSVREPDAT
jgi:hypothetical protein